jgi:type IV secretion system protein VirD4
MPSTASWAKPRDLAPLRVSCATGGRLTLGRHGRGLIAAETGQSALVIAPTQTGKTTGLAVPGILEWPGPVIATSVKNDLLRDTWQRRERLGNVLLFDPASCTGRSSQSWTPLAGCYTWDGARRTADWLTEGASPSKQNLSDADFWYAAAAKLLAPVLFAAAVSGHTMADVVSWIDTQNDGVVLDILSTLINRRAAEGLPPEANPAADAFQASITRDERQRSAVYTTAETVLEAYADPGVLAHSESCEISATELLDGNGTLYLSATVREQRRLRPVFVALLEAVIEEAYNRAAQEGSAIDPPLLVVLDEAANIAPLPDLDSSPQRAPGTACSSSRCCRTSPRRMTAGAGNARRRSSTTIAPS